MAGGCNVITIAGRLGKDPEIDVFEKADKTSMRVRFSVAVDRYKGKDDQGQAQKSTDWFTCEAWGNKADFIGSHFRKGAGIILRGDMENVKWTTDEGTAKEEKHEIWRINVQDAYFPPGGDSEGGGGRKEPPADKAKTGGATRMTQAEFQRQKAEKERLAAQQTQDKNIEGLVGADGCPF